MKKPTPKPKKAKTPPKPKAPEDNIGEGLTDVQLLEKLGL